MQFQPLQSNDEFCADVITGMKNRELADKYGRSQDHVAHLAARIRAEHGMNKKPGPDISIPGNPQFAPSLNAWLKLEGDWGLLSDFHIPYHDPIVIGKALERFKTMGLKQVCIVGDTLDGNQFHGKRGPFEHHGRTFEEDCEVARGVYRIILEHFQRVVVLNGNHDQWFASHQRGQMSLEYLFGHIYSEFGDRLQHSAYEQADLVSGGVKWKLLHGANYSAPNPLGVANAYAAKFACNVAMGHQHHHADGFSQGGHRIICMGGAYDPSRMSYLHFSPRRNPNPTRGYAAVIDGEGLSFAVGL